jgi:hypothetical protein
VTSALAVMDRNHDGKLAVLEALGYLADLGPLNSAHEVSVCVWEGVEHNLWVFMYSFFCFFYLLSTLFF